VQEELEVQGEPTGHAMAPALPDAPANLTAVDIYRSRSKSGSSNKNRELKSATTVSMDMRTVAAFLSEMKVAKDEVLRATPAHMALQRRGEALRSTKDPGRFFCLSQPVTEIDEFRSHSWHSGPWKKVLLLMVLKNGQAAVAAGTVTAGVSMLLFTFEVLPGYWTSATGLHTVWSLCTGLAASAVTLFFWKPRQKVFLDRICVNQDDEEEKCSAILSIGAIIKNSKAMLVMWDSTYVERLWCVFELAAYIKSHKGAQNQHPVIRPITLGVCAASFFVGMAGFMAVLIVISFEEPAVGMTILMTLGLAGFYVSAWGFRSFFRSVERTQEQMKAFSVEGAKCACCERGHTGENAQSMCDRKIVLSCIDEWYGSTKNFEDAVQSVVREVLAHQLGHDVLPYSWFLVASSPVVWGELDVVAVRIRKNFEQEAVYYMIVGLTWWLAVFPMLFLFWTRITHMLRHNHGRKVEVLCNLICVAAWIPLLTLTYGFQFAVDSVLQHKIGGALVFAGCWTFIILINFIQRRRRGCSWRASASKEITEANDVASPQTKKAKKSESDESQETDDIHNSTVIFVRQEGDQVYVHT